MAMKKIILLATILTLAGCSARPSGIKSVDEIRSEARYVVLAHPIETFVQMFDEDGAWLKDVPVGTECKWLGDYKWSADGGPEILFYKVSCRGVVGFVNQKWTK
jgi:hypothetical protein